MDIDLTQIKVVFDLFRSAIGAVKDVTDVLPEGEKKKAVQETLEQAEKAAQLAEAQTADALGYHLCQCTFPPQIMLSKGYRDDVGHKKEIFECPKCKKITPPKSPPRPQVRLGAP